MRSTKLSNTVNPIAYIYIDASPFKSFTGALNPDTLNELDDTALDISCRTLQTKNKFEEG